MWVIVNRCIVPSKVATPLPIISLRKKDSAPYCNTTVRRNPDRTTLSYQEPSRYIHFWYELDWFCGGKGWNNFGWQTLSIGVIQEETFLNSVLRKKVTCVGTESYKIWRIPGSKVIRKCTVLRIEKVERIFIEIWTHKIRSSNIY